MLFGGCISGTVQIAEGILSKLHPHNTRNEAATEVVTECQIRWITNDLAGSQNAHIFRCFPHPTLILDQQGKLLLRVRNSGEVKTTTSRVDKLNIEVSAIIQITHVHPLLISR